MCSLAKQDLDNYLKGSNPICREERQYALFLYNRLLDLVGNTITIQESRKECKDWFKENSFKDSDILQICGLLKKGECCEITIQQVFYEVTFMRDFYWYFKEKEQAKKFNMELMALAKKIYMLDDTKNWQSSDKNLGRIELPDPKDHSYALYAGVRNMMNSKPDIGILYEKKDKNEKEGKKYMRFVECKYLSQEGKVNGEDQHSIQNNVLRFLCDCVFDNIVADPSEKNDIVRFCKGKKNYKKYVNMPIEVISSYCLAKKSQYNSKH